MQGTDSQSTRSESMKAEIWEGKCIKLYEKVIYGNNKQRRKRKSLICGILTLWTCNRADYHLLLLY